MKICVSSLGSDLNSLIDPRFGRAQYFLFLDEKGNLDEVISNPGILANYWKCWSKCCWSFGNNKNKNIFMSFQYKSERGIFYVEK